ncbi:MAG: hypothetical protein AAGN46_06335 [Acidobacteriota bacterium]
MHSTAISVLTEEGIHGMEAEVSLRRVLAVLAAQTKELRRHLDELGLKMDDVNPSTQRTVDIVRRFHDAGLDKARSRLLFGHRGANAIVALMKRIEQFEELEQPA